MRGLLSLVEASRPGTMEELLGLLDGPNPPRPLAGGTDIMVRLEAGLPPDGAYVDLTGLESQLRYHRLDDAALEIGALATFWDTRLCPEIVSEFPLLELSARTVGALQIQGRGTWAGNIANGSPAADGVAALLAYDASLVLRSAAGRRVVPLHGFFRGYKEMDLAPGEFIEAVRLPRAGADRRWAFHKVGTRRAQAITKVGLTLNQRADGTWRVIGTSLAPFVTRYPDLERILDAAADRPPSRAALEAGVAASVRPIDDIRSTADYRRKVFLSLLLSETGAS